MLAVQMKSILEAEASDLSRVTFVSAFSLDSSTSRATIDSVVVK